MKTFGKKKISVAVALGATFALTLSANAALLCAEVFKGSFLETPDQKGVRSLQDLITQRLRKQSASLEKSIKLQGNGISVDTLVIGSGLHGSIFAANAARNNHMKDVLLIDSGDVVSKVFGEMAGTFRINSAEFEKESANVFPGSPVRMKDLTKNKFATSLDMAMMGTGAMYGSGIPVLFNNRALEITDTQQVGQKSDKRYVVKTSRGVLIRTNKIVFATGLGEPSVPLKDEGTRKMIETYLVLSESEPSKVFPIMSVDAFLRTTGLQDKAANLNFGKQFQGKTVAVVGKGDGGKIVVEALLNKGPHAQVKFSNLQIKWMGQDANTPDKYRESVWERYHTIADNIGREIEAVPGYVEKIQMTESGRIQMVYDGGKEVVVDQVLMATGYKSVVPDILSRLNGDKKPHTVTLEPLKNDDKVIGSRALIDGQAMNDIYVTGPAAGKLATEEEVQNSLTKNPVSVSVLGPFTQALANHLVKSQDKPSLNKGKLIFTTNLEVRSTDVKLPQDASVLPILLKMELQRCLGRFSGESNSIQIEVSSQDKQMRLRLRGLSMESASLLSASLQANENLPVLLKRLLDTEGSFTIKIPVMGNEPVVSEAVLEVR